MRPSPTLARTLAAAAVLLLVLPAAAAATTPFLTLVPAGDAAIGRVLALHTAALRYIDGDVDGHIGVDEPAYWDLDDSNSVSVGDLRMRPFLGLAAGTAVLLTDVDAGRLLTGTPGWFGHGAGGWFADVDNSQTVSAGDLRLDAAPAVMHAGASGMGDALAYPSSAARAGLAAFDDLDNDGRHDAGEPTYLDMDTSSSGATPGVSAGDLRVTPSAGATSSAAATQAGGDGSGGVTLDKADGGGVRGLDVLVLVLCAINLAGVAYVYRLARKGAPPRNPFK